MHKVLYLIGFMGAGKTTLAKQVAELYNFTCIDIDNEIEKSTNKTIATIFATDGEEIFRKIEAEVLRTIPITKNTIIATGGGLPCYHNNMEWMNANGTTLYLKHTISELKKRLANEVAQRPLLKKNPNMTFAAHIEGLMNIRLPYYEQAKFVILGNLISPQTVINTTLV